MPPKSKYSLGEYRRNANKVFTNRENLIDFFDASRKSLQKEKHSLLTFYGVGGEGKSALCRKLINILKEESPQISAAGLIDFSVESHRRADRALLELRKSLRSSSNGKIKFPAFEIAITLYWQQEYPELNLRHSLKDIFDENEDILSSLADNFKDWTQYAEELPAGMGLGVKFLNYLRKIAKEEYFKRAKESLYGLEHLSNHALLKKLPYIFASDILAYIEQENSLNVVLFIDTYEALWEHSATKVGIGSSAADSWVRDLACELPGALFVILGREKLTWDNDFPDEWTDCLDNQYQLHGLKDKDADNYLRLIPIFEPSIRIAIIQAAKGKTTDQLTDDKQGAHPFYLELATDLYLTLLDEGKLAEANDIATTPRELLDRFVRYRSHEEIETLKVLSVAHSFDKHLFESLVVRFQTGYPMTAFSDFINHSFIQCGQDRRYYIHALMRDHLLVTLNPIIFGEIRDYLFSYYNALLPKVVKEIDAESEFLLQQAFRYINWDSPEHFMLWHGDHFPLYYEAAKYALLVPMASKILDYAERNLSNIPPLMAILLDQLARLYLELGQYKESEPLYERALELRKKTFELDKGSEFSLTHLSAAYNNLAYLYYKQNRDDEAIPMYMEAIVINKKCPTPQYEAIAKNLNNLAEILTKYHNYEIAESYYLESLDLLKKCITENHPDFANILNNLAMLYKKQEKYEKAEILYKQSLTILVHHLPIDHLDIARVKFNLSAVYANQKKFYEAKSMLLEALEVRQNNLPADHPDLVDILKSLEILDSHMKT